MKFLRGSVSDEPGGDNDITDLNDADGFISSGYFVFLRGMPSCVVVDI
jgi:hypothetical protein